MEPNQTQLFKGKTVLVTGAARGLGHAIASAFIQAEANVVKTDIAFDGPWELVEETTMVGQENAMMLEMDVSSAEAIDSVVEKVKERFGRIDILINNAAVVDRFALIENQSLEAWEEGISVNLSGAFRCIKSVWKDMIKNNWGRIINISSFTAESGSFGQPAYGSAKAGLQGLTRALALEGAKHQVTVNAVLPGFIDTEALRRLQPEMLEKIKNRIAMKRFARPEEIADVVVFLASEASSYITGASIPITGGADLFTF